MIKRLSKLLFLIVGLILLISLGANLYIKSHNSEKILSDVTSLEKRKAALVLGASVLRRRKPSAILLERLDKAIELYRLKKVERLILSGDNSKKYYDEVTVMKEYVLRHHVRPEDTFLDHSGLRTLDSVYRARNIFLADEIYIISQRFHLPRALFLAESVKLNSLGVVADSGKVKVSYKTRGREALARVLAFFDVLMGTGPKFLGKTYSLEESGTKTWNE